ncbi:MAG: hypothetical protein JSW50_04360 [Candidatus Latescibacterota bacterium]|nr:MAG: hypothetical protein JSW50_04360 [Candidatus Latescibacterota bacterium]
MTDPEHDRETLRRALDIEWRDHFQTRRQTWKILEIATLLLLAFILADRHLGNPLAAVALGVLVAAISVTGLVATVHHRRAQIRKFTHIDRLEETLGLHKTGLLDDVHPPGRFEWIHIVDPRRINTPLFVLRGHLAILVFVVVYTVFRLILG